MDWVLSWRGKPPEPGAHFILGFTVALFLNGVLIVVSLGWIFPP